MGSPGSFVNVHNTMKATIAASTSQVHLVAVCLPGVKADRKGIANEQFWTKSERGAAKGVRMLGLRISPHGCHVRPAHLRLLIPQTPSKKGLVFLLTLSLHESVCSL